MSAATHRETKDDSGSQSSADAGATAQTSGDPSAVDPRVRLRRFRWQWNRKLLLVSTAIFAVVTSLGTVSYLYHSGSAADAFLQRAQSAAQENDFADQTKWLRRYSLLNPDDVDVFVEMALAADAAADEAEKDQAYSAIDAARSQLNTAIAQLGGNDAEIETDLRRRLINRLLQLGGMGRPWFREAERQVVEELQADPGDAQATAWLAMALIGQVNSDRFTERNAVEKDREGNYWLDLSCEPVGEVLARAIQLNPQDVGLMASFLGAYQQRPGIFAPAGESESGAPSQVADYDDLVARTLETLKSNSDSRSKLIYLQYRLGQQSPGDPLSDELMAQLMDAAESAAQRLARLPTAAEGGDGTLEPSIGVTPPDYYWDYLLVAEAALRIAERSPVLAESYFDQLTDLQLPAIPKETAERVYVAGGLFQQRRGNPEKAIEIWERGTREVNPDSIALLGAIAGLRMQPAAGLIKEDESAALTDEQMEKAIAAQEMFSEAIGKASKRLMNARKGEMSTAARNSAASRLEAAKWRLNSMEAYQAIRNGDRGEAIRLLTNALSSSAEIDDQLRVPIARQLASLHMADGSLDQAAAVLDRALQYAPGDDALRAQAAEVWSQSGNRTKAMELWRTAATSDSIALRVASVEALLGHQMSLLPEQRDFSGVRSAVRRLRQSIDDLGQPTGDQRELLESLGRRLEITEISLPPAGQSAEAYLASSQMADRVEELAAKHPKDAGIQGFAAQRLAAAGRDEASRQAIERLESILGKDATAVAVVKARIELAGGDPIAASGRLLDQAKTDPGSAAELRRMSASYASAGGDNELAYTTLRDIPQEQRSSADLFQLAMMARALPADSTVTTDQGLTAEELSINWEEQLEEREGSQASYSSFLKATLIVNDLLRDQNEIERDDPRLADASKFARKALSWRPRWGQAISLEGYLLALQGKREQAVERLRAGLAAGDRRPQTRSYLVRQLEALGRWGEVDREIRLASLTSSIQVDKYSTARIDVALKQGDYDRGIGFAEEDVKNFPDDFVSYVYLCRTATAAARAAQADLQRTEYLAKAQRAIEKAAELAGNDEPSIFSARLQLALAKDSDEAVRDEITQINDSSLSQFDKLTLQSQAHIALSEWSVAEDLLQQAYKLQPSVQIQLQLAGLFRKSGETDKEIAVLREIRQRNPDNAAVRNLLARALATRGGEGIDWQEVAGLLSGDDVSSSNRFVYAVLLLSQGSDEQKDQSLQMLREIAAEENNYSDPAARLLALTLRSRLQDSAVDPATQGELWLSEIRLIFEDLSERSPPLPADLFNFADFLLDQGNADDLPQVASLLSKLKSDPAGALFALEVAVRYEIEINGKNAAPRVIETWAKDVSGRGDLPEITVASVAGGSLLKLGFAEEGLKWMKRAYEQDANTLGRYVVALSQFGRVEDSISVSADHFRKHGDETSSVLLLETLLLDIPKSKLPEYEELVRDALKKHPKSVPLLEGVATLRLQQESYQDAIDIYHRIQKIDPMRIRTLNNLAMALSEVPGRAAEGLEPIDQAIKIAGEAPELLDTKGVVLMKAERWDEAESVFRQAMLASDEPRYEFHLIVTLIDQDKLDDAKEQWKSLDIEKLDPNGLTPAEQKRLETLKKEFAE